MSKYYSIHEFSKIIGVSAQTLRNWDSNGKLHPHHTTISGYRYYSDEQLSQVMNVKPKNRITIGYCRVSSHKQKDDLERQIDNVKTYLMAKGQPFEIISDIGSGINYKKKGLRELIKRISQNQVEKVVVLYKDRLLGLGFELVEYIASLYNCEIEIIETYLMAKGQPFEIISDIGSGMNYKKKGLRELIKRISQNQVEKVVVLYKDRLLRFGFELVEYIASLYNCEIEIIDNTEKSEQQELVEDLVQIITVFSCKLQGKRANKAKKLVQELIQEEENDGKSRKGNVRT